MNLTDALERRAERGPHRHPDDVIANAKARLLDRRTAPRRQGRFRPILVSVICAALAAGVIAIQISRTSDHDAVSSGSIAPLDEPLELTARERDDAIEQCAGDELPTVSVVDRRPSGVLVGLVLESMWRTCLFAGPPGNGPGIFINNTWSEAMSGPRSLLHEPTPEWPITVIDAKVPDGNGVDGDEMTWVWGRIDPSISSVVITTPNGLYRPTMQDGYFAAFWQGNNGDRTVVRGHDGTGTEVAFSDQLSCAVGDPVATDQGLFTAMTPRVVVRDQFAGGGCIGGEDATPGQSPDDIGD